MRYLIFICCIAISINAYSQSSLERSINQFDTLFENYKKSNEITAVVIPSEMTSILAKQLESGGDKKTAKMMRSISVISMLADKSHSESFWNDINKFIEHSPSKFKMVSFFSEDGRESYFYFKQHSGSRSVAEFVMISKTTQEQVILYAVGGFSISEITRLSLIKDGLTR